MSIEKENPEEDIKLPVEGEEDITVKPLGNPPHTCSPGYYWDTTTKSCQPNIG